MLINVLHLIVVRLRLLQRSAKLCSVYARCSLSANLRSIKATQNFQQTGCWRVLHRKGTGDTVNEVVLYVIIPFQGPSGRNQDLNSVDISYVRKFGSVRKWIQVPETCSEIISKLMGASLIKMVVLKNPFQKYAHCLVSNFSCRMPKICMMDGVMSMFRTCVGPIFSQRCLIITQVV
jgi:hypothetical protein